MVIPGHTNLQNTHHTHKQIHGRNGMMSQIIKDISTEEKRKITISIIKIHSKHGKTNLNWFVYKKWSFHDKLSHFSTTRYILPHFLSMMMWNSNFIIIMIFQTYFMQQWISLILWWNRFGKILEILRLMLHRIGVII